MLRPALGVTVKPVLSLSKFRYLLGWLSTALATPSEPGLWLDVATIGSPGCVTSDNCAWSRPAASAITATLNNAVRMGFKRKTTVSIRRRGGKRYQPQPTGCHVTRNNSILCSNQLEGKGQRRRWNRIRKLPLPRVHKCARSRPDHSSEIGQQQ